MPVRTDSAAWRNGEVPDGYFRERTREFLRENRGRAFRVRELSDELIRTNLDTVHGDGTAEAIVDGQALTRLRAYLDELADEGTIEMRLVQSKMTDSPLEEGEEVAVTYVGE